MAVASPQWKCGVCYTKTGDLVCSKCVTKEAERRRDERAERLEALRGFRESAVKTMQERRAAIEREARLQKEAADERHLKEQVREFTHRVAEERIMVASAAFSLRQQRDLLAAAESHLGLETASTEEMKRVVLDGLRRHTDDALRTLRQRRWRKVVQLFVLFPVAASIPPIGDHSTAPLDGEGVSVGSQRGTGTAGSRGVGLRDAATVSGVSTLLDLPLPNNGDYSQVPSDVLMAALGLLARLIVGIASCLGMTLPHPLFPAASMQYAAIAVDSSPRERSSLYPLCPLSKLAEIGVMGAASSVCNTVGAFETALDLLRSNVVHICVESAKVPVDRLWPAEALLLNLWELQQHAISELRSSSPMVDVPLPMPRDPTEVSLDAVGGGGGVGGSSLSGGYYDRHASYSTRLNPGAAVASGNIPEEEEDTYEFVVGEGVAANVVGEASGSGWWQR